MEWQISYQKDLAKFHADEEKFRYLLDMHLPSTVAQLLIDCGAKLYLTVSEECTCCSVLGFSLRHHNETVAWDRQ